MKEIFISYSTVDITPAETVRNVLEKNGLSCWMAPRDIPGGSNYTKEIPIAIRNCKVFLLILSKNAQSSQWVLKELDSAVNCGKVILPFMLEECILNDEFNFLLTGAQRYSAYQKKAEAMESLIGRIRSIIDAPSANTSTVQASQPEAPKETSSAKTAAVYFTEAVCSACGSEDLKPLPKRVLRQGASELATMLLIPLFGVLAAIAAFCIAAFACPGSVLLLMLLPLLAFIAGGIAGNSLSNKIVRRSRIRKRIRSTCYRCNQCDKVFLFNQAADN